MDLAWSNGIEDKQMAKNIVISIDGTGNEFGGKQLECSVKLYSVLEKR